MEHPEIGDPISTLVVFHDLLGFGSMLSASGGRFDSAVGEIAFRRILTLRKSLGECTSLFPEGTSFFHFNDAVVGILDTSLSIESGFQDPESTRFHHNFRQLLVLLRFLGASASLCEWTRKVEGTSKIGPGARTFVVLGKRWDLPKSANKDIQQIDKLHANLAFAEAYAADQAGSSAGFDHPPYVSLYVNDIIEDQLKWIQRLCGLAHHSGMNDSNMRYIAHLELLLPHLKNLSEGNDEPFPKNILPDRFEPIKVRIFHRSRKFFATAAHIAKNLTEIDMVNCDPDKLEDVISSEREKIKSEAPETGQGMHKNDKT